MREKQNGCLPVFCFWWVAAAMITIQQAFWMKKGGAEEEVSAPESAGLPNLKMVEFFGAATNSLANPAIFSVTLQNTSMVHVSVMPVIWTMVSTSPDFSSGFLFSSIHRSELSPLEGTPSPYDGLGSGELGTYSIRAHPHRTLTGQVYIRLWVNPNSGVDVFADKHEIEESDYSDNQSDILAVNNQHEMGKCNFDEEPMEENDSLTAAPIIILNTEYATMLCNDFMDIYSIDLIQGQRYRFDVQDRVYLMSITLLAPDGETVFVAEDDVVFTAQRPGIHKLVFMTGGWRSDRLVNFNISLIN